MHSRPLPAIVLSAALLGGCATQMYERSTVTLDHAELDAFQIRYEDFEGCLLRQPVPVDYRLKRPAYTLDLRVSFGTGDRSPGLTIDVSGGDDLSAKFPDLLPAPNDEMAGQGTTRYRFDTDVARDHRFTIDIYKGTEAIGHEAFGVKGQTCHAMGLGATSR